MTWITVTLSLAQPLDRWGVPCCWKGTYGIITKFHGRWVAFLANAHLLGGLILRKQTLTEIWIYAVCVCGVEGTRFCLSLPCILSVFIRRVFLHGVLCHGFHFLVYAVHDCSVVLCHWFIGLVDCTTGAESGDISKENADEYVVSLRFYI